MSKLLEDAIDQVRRLSPEEQDIAAEGLMQYVAALRHPQLSDKQIAEIQRRRASENPVYLSLSALDERLRRLGA